MSKTYLSINKFNNKIEINLYIKNVKLEEKKVAMTVKEIAKLLRQNSMKEKEIIINTDLDLEKDEREDNNKLSLISALNACKITDKNQRLEYIYMASCKYLDNEYIVKNICEFCNDICLGKRKYNIKDGCCHEFKLINILS